MSHCRIVSGLALIFCLLSATSSFAQNWSFDARTIASAGGRCIKARFEPAGGVGFNLSDSVGLDVGVFATSTNFERKRHGALAFSVRLMRGPSVN